jgi:hypothetical protein
MLLLTIGDKSTPHGLAEANDYLFYYYLEADINNQTINCRFYAQKQSFWRPKNPVDFYDIEKDIQIVSKLMSFSYFMNRY